MVGRFGDKVRYLRRQATITQTALAHYTSTSCGHINNIEAGRKTPSLDLVRRFALVLGVSTDYLLRDSVPVELSVGPFVAPEPISEAPLRLFRAKLLFLRTQRNLNQTELARQLNLRTQAHISLLEAGRKEPSIDLLLRISDFFGVRVDYLLLDHIAVESPSEKAC